MKKFELFMGCLGNGITVCNKAVMEGGDYKYIAHIRETGRKTAILKGGKNIIRKYDFENMSGIWKDEARTITEKGVFVANSGNWDLWEYSGTVYSIPVMGSGCGASVWCAVPNLRLHLYRLRQICGYSALIPHYWESVNYDFLCSLGIA